MDNFKKDTIIIGDKILDRLTDTEGMHWYPLGAFLSRILRKSDKISSFRDSNLIRFLQIIEYCSNTPGFTIPKKTWCINEKGVIFLLNNMQVSNRGKKRLYEARQKGFYEACEYFNVKKHSDINPLYVYNKRTDNINKYSVWAKLCIKYDYKITTSTKWKLCPKCKCYYPFNERYFGKRLNNTSTCLQCRNGHFKCYNKFLRYIYSQGGLSLINAIYLEKDKDIIIKRFKEIVEKEV